MHYRLYAGRQLCKSQAFFEDVPDVPHVSFSDEQQGSYIVSSHHMYDNVLTDATHGSAIVTLDSTLHHTCHSRQCMLQEVCGRQVSLTEGAQNDDTWVDYVLGGDHTTVMS